jgi:hypothetical protein
MKAFRVAGTSNDVTTCELCGRDELKGTVVLYALDADGNPEAVEHYGTSCAAKAAGWTQREVKSRAKAADTAKRDQERAVKDAASRAAYAYAQNALAAWSLTTYGITDVHVAARLAGSSAARMSSAFLDEYWANASVLANATAAA